TRPFERRRNPIAVTRNDDRPEPLRSVVAISAPTPGSGRKYPTGHASQSIFLPARLPLDTGMTNLVLADRIWETTTTTGTGTLTLAGPKTGQRAFSTLNNGDVAP